MLQGLVCLDLWNQEKLGKIKLFEEKYRSRLMIREKKGAFKQYDFQKNFFSGGCLIKEGNVVDGKG